MPCSLFLKEPPYTNISPERVTANDIIDDNRFYYLLKFSEIRVFLFAKPVTIIRKTPDKSQYANTILSLYVFFKIFRES